MNLVRCRCRFRTWKLVLLCCLPTLTLAVTDDASEFDPETQPTFRELPPEPDRDYFRADELDTAPSVEIRAKPNVTMHEYSVNGNVYMVRVEPKNAAPYYLVDANGTGQFGWHRGAANTDLLVPAWAVATW